MSEQEEARVVCWLSHVREGALRSLPFAVQTDQAPLTETEPVLSTLPPTVLSSLFHDILWARTYKHGHTPVCSIKKPPNVGFNVGFMEILEYESAPSQTKRRTFHRGFTTRRRVSGSPNLPGAPSPSPPVPLKSSSCIWHGRPSLPTSSLPRCRRLVPAAQTRPDLLMAAPNTHTDRHKHTYIDTRAHTYMGTQVHTCADICTHMRAT